MKTMAIHKSFRDATLVILLYCEHCSCQGKDFESDHHIDSKASKSRIAAVMFAAYAGAKAFGTMRKRKNGAVQNSGSSMEEQRHKNQASHGSPNGSMSR